jgi:hypothetical protein
MQRIAALDKAKLKASFEKHTSEPDISIDENVRRQRIELGRNVTQRKLIYLDIKYWIILRDVLMGCRNEALSVRLLEYLRLRVQKNEVICPISASVFIELLKQQDPLTRRKTAELIDELSLAVTLAPEEERIGTELAHFFHSYRKGNSNPTEDWILFRHRTSHAESIF